MKHSGLIYLYKPILFLTVLVWQIGLVHAQSTAPISYTDIDAQVAKYPDNIDNLEQLAHLIKRDYVLPEAQLRAAFVWVATHIKYDLDDYYSMRPTKRIYYRSRLERKRKLKIAQQSLIEQSLRTKLGLCEAYATMVKVLCDALQIPAVIINGYTKTDTRLIGTTPAIKNHAWNAVYLKDQWWLLDATWAAGNEVVYRKRWEAQFNDHYFLENPEHFIKHHFPEDVNWQLLEEPVTKASFYKTPIFYEAYYTSDTQLSEIHKGTLLFDPKSPVLWLHFDKLSKQPLYFLTYGSTTPQKIKIKKSHRGYLAKLKIKDPNPRFLTIFKDQKALIDFKIAVKQ